MPKISRITVLVELEEWDDTTDAIVWLIEQKFSDLQLPKLKLEKAPAYGGRLLEASDTQEAWLEAWTKENKKIRLDFYAEAIEIPEIPEKDEETGETFYTHGYKITVHDTTAQTKKIGEYTIKGTDRKEFQIIKEEKPQ